MDPWKQGAEAGRYTRRRVPRVTLPTSKRTQRAVFAKQIAKAKELGKRMGRRFFLTWESDNPAAGYPANFLLTPREADASGKVRDEPDPLPKKKGKRFALAAIALYQALAKFEDDIDQVWKKSDWRIKTFFRARREFVRRELRTLIQTLLFQSWPQISMRMRDMVIEAFENHPAMHENWQKICRGSLSVAFVARGFHGIETTSRSLRPSTDQWRVYQSTNEEDNRGKIDLIAVGRMRGLGKVVLCIQVKTGHRPYLEALLQDPSETRGGEAISDREQLKDALWEGTEDFKEKHEITGRCYPVIIQTGQAPPDVGVTEIGTNAKALRPKIRRLLKKVENDLRTMEKAKRDLREIDKPGIPLRPRRTQKT